MTKAAWRRSVRNSTMRVLTKSSTKERGPTPSTASSASFSTASSASSAAFPFPRTPGPGFQLPISARSTPTLPSPQYALRAVRSYQAAQIWEVSFGSGDFFYLLGERIDELGNVWFEASNPSSGARGLVPSDYFEILGRSAHVSTDRIRAGSLHSNLIRPQSKTVWPPITDRLPNARVAASREYQRNPLFGTVREEFRGERTDELNAEKGESLVIMAHSEAEWLVGKPIGRLGGPGLIPLSFVQVKQISSGKTFSTAQVKELIGKGGIPQVDDWKAATAAYKDNSIALGTFDFAPPVSVKRLAAVSSVGLKAMRALRVSKSHQQISRPSIDHSRPPPPVPSSTLLLGRGQTSFPVISHPSFGLTAEQPLPHPTNPTSLRSHKPANCTMPVMSPKIAPSTPLGAALSNTEEPRYATVDELRERYGQLVHASVQSFHQEAGQFWFHVRSHFRTPRGTTTVLVLYRLYDQFFEFNASLAATFADTPELPKPVPKVDELVCARWVEELTDYLTGICHSREEIRSCEYCYEFLGPREGDVELTRSSTLRAEAQVSTETEMEVVTGRDRSSSTSSTTQTTTPPSLSNRDSRSSSFVGKNTCEAPLSPVRARQSSCNNSLGRTRKNSEPPSPPIRDRKSSSFPELRRARKTSEAPTLFSHALGGHAPTFHRIKVFQLDNDDVFAIRVAGSVDYAQLLAKVEERVGSGASGQLKVREEGTTLSNDEDVRNWLRTSSRLLLTYDCTQKQSASFAE